MSPSEADLRAALREGEGDGVDPYDIIFAARQQRAHRRTVLLSAAAAVIFVGGAAAGGAALINAGNPSTTGGGNGAGLADQAAGIHANASTRGAMPNASAPEHGTMNRPAEPLIPLCLTPQIRRTPTSGGTKTSGPLLVSPVQSFIICEYSVTSLRNTRSAAPLVVSGAAARSLVASLANTATTPVPPTCPLNKPEAGLALTMTPVAPDGRHLTPLTAMITKPECTTTVSNGTSIRYGWQVPPRIFKLLGQTTAAAPSGSPEMPIDLVPSRVHRPSSPPTN